MHSAAAIGATPPHGLRHTSRPIARLCTSQTARLLLVPPNLPQWKKAVADGSVNQAAPTPPEFAAEAALASGEVLSLGELMAFSGPAPELINGRLAMLAFIAALGAELSSGEGVLRQFAEEPTGERPPLAADSAAPPGLAAAAAAAAAAAMQCSTQTAEPLHPSTLDRRPGC